MFYEENLISFGFFLSFCLSVHNTYVQPWLWGYVFFAKIFVFFRIIFIFFAKFSLHFFAKQIEAKFTQNFAKKAKIFAFFVSERNAKTKRNGRKKKNFAKNAKFSQNDFSFLLEILRRTHRKILERDWIKDIRSYYRS